MHSQIGFALINNIAPYYGTRRQAEALVYDLSKNTRNMFDLFGDGLIEGAVDISEGVGERALYHISHANIRDLSGNIASDIIMCMWNMHLSGSHILVLGDIISYRLSIDNHVITISSTSFDAKLHDCKKIMSDFASNLGVVYPDIQLNHTLMCVYATIRFDRQNNLMPLVGLGILHHLDRFCGQTDTEDKIKDMFGLRIFDDRSIDQIKALLQ